MNEIVTLIKIEMILSYFNSLRFFRYEWIARDEDEYSNSDSDDEDNGDGDDSESDDDEESDEYYDWSAWWTQYQHLYLVLFNHLNCETLV